jgi:lipopolysaccharide export LptBFGC system permease protein LptF
MMLKMWFNNIRRKKHKHKQTRKRFNRDRVALWLAMVQMALLSVIFLYALVRKNMELVGIVLPVLIFALKQSLQHVFGSR